MFVEGYTTVEAHEKYIDKLARSAARCKERLRIGHCKRNFCESCEKAKSLSACVEMFDEYSKVVYNDLVDDYSAAYAEANPTADEMERRRKIRRQAEIDGTKKAMREMNHDWFFYHMGWFYVLMVVLVPILFPLIGIGLERFYV